MAEITVYTTEPCRYCSAVKALLGQRGLSFQEINLARDAQGRAELARRTGMMTFPQVLIDGTLLGGFEETRAAAASGRLAALLHGERREEAGLAEAERPPDRRGEGWQRSQT